MFPSRSACSCACDHLSAPPAPAPGAGSPALPPAGVCQARLWGKLANAASGTAIADAEIEITSGDRTFKTRTDANGFYGFAGLCTGEYSIRLPPPSAQLQSYPTKAGLDNNQQLRMDLSFK